MIGVGGRSLPPSLACARHARSLPQPARAPVTLPPPPLSRRDQPPRPPSGQAGAGGALRAPFGTKKSFYSKRALFDKMFLLEILKSTKVIASLEKFKFKPPLTPMSI